MLVDWKELIGKLKKEQWAEKVGADERFWARLSEWTEENVLSTFINRVASKIEDLAEIDPDLPEKEILSRATKHIVEFLGAQSASVRIYDPLTEQMLSYGSHPFKEESRATSIPLEGSIAGEVVKTRNSCLVPNILKEARYVDKEVIHKRGVRSMMAVPLDIPSFFHRERDTFGVLQIYFTEKDRKFSTLEVQVAELMAKRLSYAIARKKITSLSRVDAKKEAIVQHIFRKLGSTGGIKMVDVFNTVIPELADMVDVQSCSLFKVNDDLNHVMLEAAYPKDSYHSIGESFPVHREPAFEILLNLKQYSGDSVYETVTPSYILVMDPSKSKIISDSLKQFAEYHNINSILYVPLKVNGEVSHFLALDALDQRQRYLDDEIELILFLGRELIKAGKMERLDDALHDFKNPAIATAGFARRLKALVEQQKDGSDEQIRKYADILFIETSRLQELALSIYKVGEEQIVNITNVLRRRFDINREAIREQLRQDINLVEGPFNNGLYVECYPIHVERVFDNLLNNATKAIPIKGGTLSIKTYAKDKWACAEISNTGYISEEDRIRLLEGEGEGRGLYITNRIIRILGGKIRIREGRGTTTFMVYLPRFKGSE